MKRLTYTIFIFILAPAWVNAQSGTSTTFTLDQCITYALENTVNIKNARVDEEIALAKVRETRGIGLPQVDGTVGLTHNQKLPRFFASYGTAQGFAGVDDDGNPNLDIPGLNTSDIVASQNFFQLKSSGNAGLSINQILFNSSYLVGLKAASTYKELSSKATEQTSIQIIENVMTLRVSQGNHGGQYEKICNTDCVFDFSGLRDDRRRDAVAYRVNAAVRKLSSKLGSAGEPAKPTI